MIDELSQEKKQEVVEQTAKYIALANKIGQTSYPMIPIQFDLKGHTVGMYKKLRQQKVIRYNSLIFSKYFKENLRDTVPHEVAHYIVDMQFGRKKIRPHGVEWKELMALFGANASRTACYNLTGIPKRRYSTIQYQCECQTHQLGIRCHNKVIQRRTDYYCRQCGDLLKAV
ncbi:MAG: metallopeptidase [Cycloclasticus sp. symbiont of Poecilosclerida sp. N]|nr:MAG: metallopeptidase [Cycloclasticus sp. symbiont of Poecilosclerida sp. N]